MPSSEEAFEKAVEALAARQFEWTVADRDAMPCSWRDCGEESKESWRKKARADLEAALPHLQSVQTGGEGLSKDTLEIACNCIGDTYRIEPDDHPDPNGATKAWRELRSAIRLIDSPPPTQPASTEGDLRERLLRDAVIDRFGTDAVAAVKTARAVHMDSDGFLADYEAEALEGVFSEAVEAALATQEES
jgi:hypothetical protein